MTEKEEDDLPMRFTHGKHPIEIGGMQWQIIKGLLTALTLISFAYAYMSNWLLVVPGVFFGFFAFNFWWVEYQVFAKRKELGWGT